MTSRRAVIGGAGALVLAGLGYRAWDRGVFDSGGGEAFAPWNDWRGNAAEGVRRPLHAAILAASPHDTQPWLFASHGDTITVSADRSRNLGAFDPFRREMHLGVGCAIENLMRAATVFGYSMNVLVQGGRLTPQPGNAPVRTAQLWLENAAPIDDPLFAAIPKRHTNRGLYRDSAVDPKSLRALADLVSDNHIRVAFLVDPGARREMASLIVEATEAIIGDAEMSAASARWLRTGRAEIAAHRDGIGTDTAGLSPLMAATAKMMPDADAATADRDWLGRTRDVQTSAPVLGVLMVQDRLDMGSAIAAGRAWQRLHLAATGMGLAAQPLNQPVECVDRAAQLGRGDHFGGALSKLAQAPGWEATFCFRLGFAEHTAPPSARRPLSAVVTASA